MQVDLQAVMTNFFAIIISLTIHEFAHAFVADKMGDPTPARYDRLNLNPLTIIKAHPFGALIIPLIGSFNGFLLGWAATPVNPHLVNRKYTLRQAERWISLAGPISNVILAILCGLLYAVLAIFVVKNGQDSYKSLEPLLHLSNTMVITNVFLALFNMIPVPPFDGFTILSNSIPAVASKITGYLEQYGNMILIFVFIFGGRILSPLIHSLSVIIFNVCGSAVGLVY